MRAQKSGGSITFTASISAHNVNFPQPQAAYNVSKAAIVALVKSLAAEWAVDGIRVNSISPVSWTFLFLFGVFFFFCSSVSLHG